MKTKILAISVATVMMLMMFMTSAAASTTVNKYEWGPWIHTQDYYGWGPALYYGEDVHVVYESVNQWTVKIKTNKDSTQDLMQNLQQHGTAKIYSIATGELLDTREFFCYEKDIDDGMDAGTWDGTWYVAWGLDFSKLEVLQYEWLIPGVYHFRAYAENGVYLQYEYTVPGVIYYSWI